MIAEKELTEYRTLCATLISLHERFIKKKDEFRLLLEETVARRREALLVLAKANRLTRHLTGRQRQIAGLSYHLGEIKIRINQAGPVLFSGVSSLDADIGEGEAMPEIRPEIQENFLNRRELRQRGFLVIGLIDRVKKKLFQLEILELRCRELILSITKALEAFRHEWRQIRRKIYPFGIFSLVCRSLQSLSGGTYFSTRDMDDVAALGNITGLILKIADSSLV